MPSFQTTASDHPTRARSDPSIRARIRLRNSFTPTQPVSDPRMFSGRREVLTDIIRAIEDQRSHIVIYGERGVGKTSLLRMITASAVEARFIVVYFSCGASSDFTETFQSLAAEIPLLYHSSISPSSSNAEIGSTLSDLLGPGKLTPRMFGDAAAKLVGTRVLLLLDEFDRSESAEFRRDVAELIKTLSDVSARVQLVIAGVAADLADLIEHIPSIRRNISAIRVNAMPDEEVRTLIENGARMSGVEFDDQARDLITAASRGSPYIANLLCHVAGLQALEAGRLRVDPKDIVYALEHVLEEFRGRLPSALLKHLDQVGGALDAEDIDGKSPRELTGAVRGSQWTDGAGRVIDRLERDGVLNAAKSASYALMVDSLAPYLQLKKVREELLNEAA